MRTIKNILWISILAFLIAGFTSFTSIPRKESRKEGKPRQIILMIGDGMGITQVYAAMTAQKGTLQMARCPYTGFVKTNSADNYVTDSAAGGTAYSTGKKVNNGVLGISPSGDTLQTLFDYAKAAEKSTGFAVTCAVTHATPASFYAHVKSRDDAESIALQLSQADIDCWFGGGLKYFTNRDDKIVLTDTLKKRGYSVLTDVSNLLSGDKPFLQSSGKNSVKLAGLFYDEHPPRLSKGRDGYFEQAVTTAIDVLDNDEDGFFLMVEASQIDWGGHLKSEDYIIQEAVEFDQVIGKVLDYAQKDGNTLVIITADHETGGMTVPGGSLENGEVKANFTTFDHTGTLVPIFAYGPGSQEFTGLMENTDVFKKILQLINEK